MTRISLIGICCAIVIGLGALSKPAELLKVTAQEGDGIHALLRRYQLASHSCNYSQFYTLNKLNKNSPLIKGRSYVLPIETVTFDGKTIRSSIGIKDYDKALSIQRYNEAMLSAGLREKSFQEDKVLWVPHHLLYCGEPDLGVAAPAAEPAGDPDGQLGGFDKVSNPAKRIFPIFGEKYAYTPLKSKALEGRIFYLISGHGGPDPGAMAKRAGAMLCEDEYAYDVTLRLCRKLIENGATAYMIVRDPDDGIRSGSTLSCDEDEIVWGGKTIRASQISRLQQRTDIVNELYLKNRKLGFTQQHVIEIHVDSRSQSEQVDLFFYYQHGSEGSKKLAEQLQEAIRSKYKVHRKNGNYHGTVSSRGLFTLRETKPETVYIELGNIRNSNDQKRILLDTNREALASWLLEGLMKNN